jgi:C-terminal processing protease CtpA/Prc
MKNHNVLDLLFLCGFIASACGRAPSKHSASRVMSFEHFQRTEQPARWSNSRDAHCSEYCQSLRQEFRYVVAVGKEIYCYWDLKTAETGIDYEVEARDLEQSITDETGFPEYYQIVARWAGSFHDGHVNAINRNHLNELKVFQPSFELSSIAPATDHERVIVTESADPAIQAGDEIIGINGLAIGEALDELETQRSGSTTGMRRVWPTGIGRAFGSAAGATDLTIDINRDGTALTLSTFRIASIFPDTQDSPPTGNTTARQSVKIKVLPGSIGYLRMDTFGAEGLEGVLDRAMDLLVGTKGLILDVRANGGGNFAGNQVIARLIDTAKTRYEISARKASFVYNSRPEVFLIDSLPDDLGYTNWTPAVIEPATENKYLGKPVVVLTSPRCFSACDTFVAALKSHNLATVIGERTGGGTGTPLEFKLPVSGLSFRYSVYRGRTIDGDWIEGIGTIPDHLVEANLQTILGTSDNQLEFAYNFVRLQTTESAGQLPVADLLRNHGSVYRTQPGVSSVVQELLDLNMIAVGDEYLSL